MQARLPVKRVATAMIAAPDSGQGKSVITAGLARLHRKLGRRMAIPKSGPGYLDPMELEQASGHPFYQLHAGCLAMPSVFAVLPRSANGPMSF